MDVRRRQEDRRAATRRALVAAAFVLVCFGILAARLYHLQVAQYDYFHSRAEGNRIARERGLLRD